MTEPQEQFPASELVEQEVISRAEAAANLARLAVGRVIEQSGTPLPASATSKVKRFLGIAFGDHPQPAAYQVTQDEVELFGHALVNYWLEMTEKPIDSAAAERQHLEMLLNLRGYSDPAIIKLTGLRSTPGTIAGKRSHLMLEATQSPSYGQWLDKMVTHIFTPPEQEEVVDQSKAANVVAADVKDFRPDKKIEAVTNRVKRYWKAEDITSLGDYLYGDTEPQAADQLRTHLVALLGKYQPDRPIHRSSTTGMSAEEWTAVNLASGYRLKPGQQPMSLNQLTYFVTNERYEQEPRSAEELFGAGLAKLVTKARQDYLNDWYPVPSEDPSEAKDTAPEIQINDESASLPGLQLEISQLLDTFGLQHALKPEVAAALKAHFCGLAIPRPNEDSLREGLGVVRQWVNFTQRRMVDGGNSKIAATYDSETLTQTWKMLQVVAGNTEEMIIPKNVTTLAAIYGDQSPELTNEKVLEAILKPLKVGLEVYLNIPLPASPAEADQP